VEFTNFHAVTLYKTSPRIRVFACSVSSAFSCGIIFILIFLKFYVSALLTICQHCWQIASVWCSNSLMLCCLFQ